VNSLQNARPTQEYVEARRIILSEVIEEFARQKLIPNENAIIKTMIRRGYPDYNRNKLFTDKTMINSQSNYIRYFLPNYSAYQESINSILQFVTEQSQIQYHKVYTQSKKVIREELDKEGNIVKLTTNEITTELAGPKVWFLNTMLRAAKLMQDHAQGQNVHIGAITLQKEFARKDEIIAELQKQSENQYNPKNLPVLVK
jgi:hypothetical protein